MKNAIHSSLPGLKYPWRIEVSNCALQWVAAIGRSHGVQSKVYPRAWVSKQPMPLRYPNLITLKPVVEIDSELEGLRGQLPNGWGIKDSFSSLQIAARGFKVAIDAHWYMRPPEAIWPRDFKYDDAPLVVETSLELNEWAVAWGGSRANRTFLASLLIEPDIGFLFVRRAGEIVAGLATNLSDQVIGVSNGFGATADILGCIRSVAQRYPERAIVGYGSAVELASLEPVGFTRLGDLRVWLSD